MAIANYAFPDQSVSFYKYLFLNLSFVDVTSPGFEEIKNHFNILIPKVSPWITSLNLGERAGGALGFCLATVIFWIIRLVVQLGTTTKIEEARKKRHATLIEKAEEERRSVMEKYALKLEEYNKKIEKREGDIAEFSEEKKEYETERKQLEEAFEINKKAYEDELSQHNDIVAINKARYLEEFKNYEAEVMQLKSFRQELWDRARMCTRCGTMYMGPRNQ